MKADRTKSALRSRRAAGALLLLASLPAPSLWAAQAKPLAAVDGKLAITAAGAPILKTQDGVKALASVNSYLLHTLQDERLRGREVRLEGTPKPHGVFEVERIFVVRDGRLFRIRYYCRVCNIEALEPGPCVCCQQPTELQEIPVEPAKP